MPKDLVKEILYSKPDLNSQIPDVDQMAEFFIKDLCLPRELSLKFKKAFFEHLGDEQRLKAAIFENVIKDLKSLMDKCHKENKRLKICCWTQGNVFLQTRKAEVFLKEINADYIANPAIYASLDKLALLPKVFENLFENLDKNNLSVCLIDDRSENILNAHALISKTEKYAVKSLFVRKLRPDKPLTDSLTENLKDLNAKNIIESAHWENITELLLKLHGENISLILDLDGVIYNSTAYRRGLESSLADLCNDFLNTHLHNV